MDSIAAQSALREPDASEMRLVIGASSAGTVFELSLIHI